MYQLHEKLGLDTLATHRAKSMVKLLYSCIHDKELAYLFDHLKQIDHGARVTRAVTSGNMEVPEVESKYGQYAFGF